MTTALNKHNYNIFLSKEFSVNGSQTLNQYNPRITVLESSVVVAWTSVDSYGKRLVYQKQLKSFANQEKASLVSTQDKLEGYTPSTDSLYGNYAITFTGSKLNQDKTNIYSQVYDDVGSVLNQEFKLDNSDSKHNQYSNVALLYNGEMAAVWTSNDQDKKQKNTQQIFGCVTKNTIKNQGIFNCNIEANILILSNATLTCNQNQDVKYNYIFSCIKLFQKTDVTVSTFECSSQTKKLINQGSSKKTDATTQTIDMSLQCSVVVQDKKKDQTPQYNYECVKVNPESADIQNNRACLDFTVNDLKNRTQNEPQIAALYPDKFIVVWTNDYQNQKFISAQAFDDSGKKFGNEFKVHDSSNNQDEPSITGLHNGQFVVSWNSIVVKANQEKEVRVFAQIFNSDLTKIGTAFQVNPHFFPYQHSSRVKVLYDTSFVVSWLHEGMFSGIYLQRYSVTGKSLGPELRIHTHHIDNVTEYDVGSFRNGTMFAVWSDNVLTGNKNYNIYGKYFLMPTQTATMSLSSSETATQTESNTESKSYSDTDSLSDSSTVSQSDSQSSSLSNTQSNSDTLSETISNTRTKTQSLSSSDSESKSVSNSESQSLSKSVSSTDTDSLSRTSSLSTTTTESITLSESQSNTLTKSETSTETKSVSTSYSSTATNSVSATEPITNTQSVELTDTQSNSVTKNVTISPTFTDTLSVPLIREIKPLFSRVINIDDSNIKVVYGTVESEQFIISSQIKDLTIISNGGPDKFTLYPSANSTVTVLDFSVDSIIDLSNIPNLVFFDQLSFRKGSCIVEIRYSQTLIIKNHDCNVISEGNFILPSNCIKGQECITNELGFNPIYSYLYQTGGREVPVNVPGTPGDDQFFISGIVSRININSGGGTDKYTIYPAFSNPRITSITDFTPNSIIDLTDSHNYVKSYSALKFLGDFPCQYELSPF